MSGAKLDRDKFMTEEELKRLLLAVRTRVRTSYGRLTLTGNWRPGNPHPHMERDYALLATSALTGIREVELTGFRIADLRGVVGEARDERPARVKIRRAKKKDRKTGEPIEEEVALPETARRALAAYIATLPDEEREPWSRVFPLSTKQVQRLFKLYCRRAGLNPVYSMHSLRHSRGTILYEKHRDLKLVQQALGHSKLETSAIYMHTVELDEKLAATDLNVEGEDAQDGEGSTSGTRDGDSEPQGGSLGHGKKVRPGP